MLGLRRLRERVEEALARNAEAAARLVRHAPVPLTMEFSGNGAGGHDRRAAASWHIWNGRRWQRRAVRESEE